MNFKDEYKKEISKLTPDEAAAERIRKGVMERLSQPETPVKKPLPIKRIAVIGASAAACLIIGLSAIAVHNQRSGNFFVSEASPNASNGGGSQAHNFAGGADGTNSCSSMPSNNAAESISGSLKPSDDMHTEGDNKSTMGENSEPQSPSHSEDTGMPGSSNKDNTSGLVGSASETAVITFEGDSFTLDLNGSIRRLRPADNNNEMSSFIRPDELTEELIKADTPDGERYFILFRENDVMLLSAEYKVLGLYVGD